MSIAERRNQRRRQLEAMNRSKLVDIAKLRCGKQDLNFNDPNLSKSTLVDAIMKAEFEPSKPAAKKVTQLQAERSGKTVTKHE